MDNGLIRKHGCAGGCWVFVGRTCLLTFGHRVSHTCDKVQKEICFITKFTEMEEPSQVAHKHCKHVDSTLIQRLDVESTLFQHRVPAWIFWGIRYTFRGDGVGRDSVDVCFPTEKGVLWKERICYPLGSELIFAKLIKNYSNHSPHTWQSISSRTLLYCYKVRYLVPLQLTRNLLYLQ